MIEKLRRKEFIIKANFIFSFTIYSPLRKPVEEEPKLFPRLFLKRLFRSTKNSYPESNLTLRIWWRV